MAFLVGSTALQLQRLAVPAATILIAILGYGSQILFATSPDLEPGPLTQTQSRVFNCLLACLWWTYWRACTVDPGRYIIPHATKKTKAAAGEKDDDENDETEPRRRRRWCRKCSAPKPPRAHHCKICRRCIPKMDHHCPWTGNCVSLQTYPHFVRFVIYTNMSLWTLAYFLVRRFVALWHTRHLPAYLGPTPGQLAALATLSFLGFLTTLALGIILFTTLRSWVFNTTTIEDWEIERHEAVLHRRGSGGGEEDWWGPSGGGMAMTDPVEFPYDVGIWNNMVQAMGTRNPLFWFFPFAGAPQVASLPAGSTVEDVLAKLNSGGGAAAERLGTGWFYEENGLNDGEGMWPPVDPDKVRNARLWRRRQQEEEQHQQNQGQSRGLDLGPEAFRRRQERDLQRWRRRGQQGDGGGGGNNAMAEIMDELEETDVNNNALEEGDDYDFIEEAYSRRRPIQNIVVREGKSGWVNAEGEHLGDYGVDEEAEFDDDDDADHFVYEGNQEQGPPAQSIDLDDEEDIPLAELIRRRKVRTHDGDDT
ncbi:zf-DHHC-domain-containing protein [Poronia punctata]|nr:zf-DHHC-domain-containing protein [Poronia punctata]